MAKAGVMEEVVTPLLKHLERVEREASTKHSYPDKDKFKKVRSEIEIAKEILIKTKNWEGELIDMLRTIERHLDCMLDGDICQITTELDAILKKTEVMNDMIKPLKELPDAERTNIPKKQSKLEVGEPSNTKIIDERDEICYFHEEKIMKLNPKLALCAFSLSVFPVNFKLKKRLLIYWWIGLELIQGRGTTTAESTGEFHFEDLVSLRILRPAEGTKDVYIIEPKVHAQLVSIAEKRKFIHNRTCNSTGGSSSFLVCAIQISQSKFNTLINVDEKYLKTDFIHQQMTKNNNLCCVQLGPCSVDPHHHVEVDKTDFLKELKPCLTYLSLQGISRITELPDSIGNLGNLIVLNLRACHNLEKLPSRISSMIKLTHLDVSMCYLLDHFPKWVGSLSNLQVLKGFVIGSLSSSDRCRLTDLANLVKLRKLSMTAGRESVVGPEELNSLKKLTQLRSLTIIWGSGEYDETTLNISPPENLEKLDLRCYPQEVMPKYEGLKILKRLYIRGGKLKKLENKMATVEVLRLRFLQHFETPLDNISSFFPNLKYLEPVKCNKMQKINTVDGFWTKERDGPLPQQPSTDKGHNNKSKSLA